MNFEDTAPAASVSATDQVLLRQGYRKPGTGQDVHATLSQVLGMVGPCKFGALQTRMPFNGSTNPTSTGNCIFTALTAEADYDWVRLVFLNQSTTAGAITAVSVAPSASASDFLNPVNSAGVVDNTLWKPVYFNGGGADGSIPPPSGTTRTLTQTAGVAGSGAADGLNVIAAVQYSDWVQVSSLARIDTTTGTLPLLFIRTYSATSFSTNTSAPITAGAGFDPVASGRIIRTYNSGTDSATTPGTVSGGVSANAYMACFAVQYMSRKRGLTVAAFGDSLFQGYGTTTKQNNPFHIAISALSTPSFPVSFVNAGYQGQRSANIYSNATAMVPGLKPDVAIFKAESPNDGGAATQYALSIPNGFAFADYCIRNQIVPVLSTAMPWGYSGAVETARLAFNAAIRTSGYLYIDFDAAMTDGASPAHILPAYNSATFPGHYNDAGAQAIANYVIPVLAKIMGQRPR